MSHLEKANVILRFNSKLVRLEGEFEISHRTLSDIESFNSKLVRLEVSKRCAVRHTRRVSIPNWCD